MRKILEPNQLSESAATAINQFHPEVVQDVEAAVKANKYVIVGMGQNPVVKKARRLLDDQKIEYKYIGHGNYFSMWKPRLAIKLWSGWPTFPMVFIDGKLIGGAHELSRWLAKKS